MATAEHLTLGDIVDIRDSFAAADPERFEIVNTPGLLSALTTPFQAAFGQEAFPELVDKAAALAFLLIANHPFRDGNKRIGREAMRLFLERNGLALGGGPEALRSFTRPITTTPDPRDQPPPPWLAPHPRPPPPPAPAPP